MKCVMYHYVREYSATHPNFRFLDINNFRRQLDFFAEEYGFVSRGEWDKYTTFGTLPDQQGKVILTFDDAMRCHYDYVYPELLKRGLWGVFYVPTSPYNSKKMLDVHRIHLMCGAIDVRELLDYAMDFISEEMLPDKHRADFNELTYKLQINHKGISDFKRILNYFVDYDFRSEIIDNIATHFGYEFPSDEFYVEPQCLVEMEHNGMVIGAHSVDHLVMSKLLKQKQFQQINGAFNYLKSIGCEKVRTYCHPHGRSYSFNQHTVDILDSLNVLFSFAVEPREIASDDIDHNRQSLPRFDCNQFPFGLAS